MSWTDRFSGNQLTGAMGVVAAAANLVALFVTFKIALAVSGIGAIGLWALIQGIFLVSRVSESGVGPTITRELAVRTQPSLTEVRNVLWSGWILTAVPVIGLGLLLVGPCTVYASRIASGDVPIEYVGSFVWTALICAAIGSTTLVLGSVIEGLGALRAKSGISLGSSLVTIVLAGPIAAAADWWAPAALSLLLSMVQLVGLGLVVLFYSGRLPRSVKAIRSVRHELSHLWRPTLQLSVAGILRLGLEPTAKIAMAAFGSVSSVGIFELALRLATHLRLLCQAAVHPLLYLGARRTVALDAINRERFLRADRFMMVLATGLVEAQLLLAPILSFVAFAELRSDFMLFVAMLAVANGLNATGIVGYYARMASGEVAALLHIQTAMAALNLTLAAVLGLLAGSEGVVAAYSVILAGGGLAARRFLNTGAAQPSRPFQWRWVTGALARLGASLALLLSAAPLIAIAGVVPALLGYLTLATGGGLQNLRWLLRQTLTHNQSEVS